MLHYIRRWLCRTVATFPFIINKQLCTSCNSLIHQQRNGSPSPLDAVACSNVKGSSWQCHVGHTVLTADVLLSHLYDHLCWTAGKLMCVHGLTVVFN